MFLWFNLDIFRKEFTKLAIFFNDEHVETVKRMETNTIPNFLSECGGLLGLFLGISALGFIEPFYYLTLGLFWSIRRSLLEKLEVVYLDNADSNTDNGSVDTNNKVNRSELYYCMLEFLK